MARRSVFVPAMIIVTLLLLVTPAHAVKAESITPADLINMMNAQRTAHGLAALVENSILNSQAQWDAEYMLSIRLMSDIGGVKQRLTNAGYGNGKIIFATENWAMNKTSIDAIRLEWSDDLHMLPVTNPYYKNVGAAIATNGTDTYYILIAAYVEGGYAAPTENPLVSRTPTTSQYMQAVVTSTPLADGTIAHIVESGQTLWSIAIAYGTHIEDIKALNKLTRDTVYVGETLIIRLALTVTPTPEITVTPPLPSRTAAPTQYLKMPSRTPLPTATATPEPAIPGFGGMDRRTLGIVIIAVCSLGLAVVLLVSSLRNRPKHPDKPDL